MGRFALALLLALSFPLASSASSKDIERLEKTLAHDRDAHARAEAAWDLGHQLGSTESVPVLITALENDSSAAVRANAAASLWHLGDASRAAVPALTKALDDPSGAVVGNAAGALIKLGTPKSKVVPAYRKLLTRPDCEDRVVALKALATEAPATELFDSAWECAELNPGLDSDDRSAAREALRKIVGRKDRALAPRILQILQKELGTADGSTLILAIGNYDPPVKEAEDVHILVYNQVNAAVSGEKSAMQAAHDLQQSVLDLMTSRGYYPTKSNK